MQSTMIAGFMLAIKRNPGKECRRQSASFGHSANIGKPVNLGQ